MMDPVLAAAVKTLLGLEGGGWFYGDSVWWTVFGLTGNIMFSLRFVVQWLMSEKSGEIVIPPAFWYLSFFGSIINLIYAFHLDKLPLILGFIFLPFINYRNLRLMWRKQREERERRAAAEALERGEISPEEAAAAAAAATSPVITVSLPPASLPAPTSTGSAASSQKLHTAGVTRSASPSRRNGDADDDDDGDDERGLPAPAA